MHATVPNLSNICILYLVYLQLAYHSRILHSDAATLDPCACLDGQSFEFVDSDDMRS